MKRNTAVIVVCACIVLLAVCVCIALIIVFHGVPGNSKQKNDVWDNIRLPKSLIPSRYDVHLRSDFVNFIFNGSVSIDVRCDEDTDIVVLHCAELNISDVSVTSIEAPHPTWDSNPPLKGKPWLKEENQYLVFELERSLVKGTMYTIHVSFSGPLEQDYVGYYATPYETSSGTRWVGSTQLAVLYARQAFPCFDEPALKARFLLTLDHAPEYQAISNMPLTSTLTLEDDWIRTKFNESVPMSTYLMAWSVFDFAHLEKTTSDGVLFRVWARPDAIDAANYALERGADIIDFYGEYFGTRFPLPKMDFVAVPGYQIIAMENWGMNVFEPAKFLYEEGVITSSDQLTICAWIAHQLAHQWFGNLVTFKWWDDLWLNEGFASYVEYLGTNYTEPDWNVMDMFMWRDKYPVLVTDSLVTSRPISMSVTTNNEIFQQFDWISYNKGASILRMLSNFLGEKTFRKGLKSYLETFAYNNTDKDGLWMQLNEAAVNDGKGHMNVKEIMDTWTLQMGYPLVTLTRDYSRDDAIHFTAEQQRFLLNPDHPEAGKHQYQWHVPLTFTTSRHLQFDNPPQEWLTPGGGTKQLSVSGAQNSDWLLANVESLGYYRVNYDLTNWAMITEQLRTAHDVIPPASRSALINDGFNLARSGYLDPLVALNLTKYLTHEKDFVPWAAVDEVMGFIEVMLRDTNAHSDFKRYMLQLITPSYDYVDKWITEDYGDKWNGTFGERRLQAITFKLACAYNHSDCISRSKNWYRVWKATGIYRFFRTDVSEAVYCTAIAHGDQTDWEFAFNQYRNTNSDTEKLTLLSGMTCSKDSVILKRYLSYLLGIDVISDASHERVLSGILANEAGTDLAWNFFWEHFDTFFKIHGENFFNFIAIATSLTSTLNSENQLSLLKSKLAENPNQGAAQRTFTQGVEITEANIRWMQNNYDAVASWLKEQ